MVLSKCSLLPTIIFSSLLLFCYQSLLLFSITLIIVIALPAIVAVLSRSQRRQRKVFDYLSLPPLRERRSYCYSLKAITIWGVMKKRSFEPKYKTNAKIKQFVNKKILYILVYQYYFRRLYLYLQGRKSLGYIHNLFRQNFSDY